MRVNVDRWNVLLDFAEKHPSIITQKFQGVHGRQNQIELWDELSNKLNSLGCGEKTIKEWKKTLIDWKSKVKAKAGGIRSYESQTGGGPPCNEQLSAVEHRLLFLMGKSSYEGDPENNEVGLKKRRLNDNQFRQDMPLHRKKEEGNEKVTIISNQIFKSPAIKVTSTVLSGISSVSTSSMDFCQTVGTPKLILGNPNKACQYPYQTSATVTKHDQAVHTSSRPPQISLNENIQKKNITSYDILKDMKMNVTKLPIHSATPECSLKDPCEMTESNIEQRHSQKTVKTSGSTATMLSMHNDLVDILEKININLGSLATSAKEMVDILKN